MQLRMILLRSYYKVQAFVVMNGNLCRGCVWGKVLFWSRKLQFYLTKEVYGMEQSVVSTHCINKAFVYANSSTVKHETFLTDGCKRTWVCVLSHWKFDECLISYCLFITTVGGTCLYVPHDIDCVGESWYSFPCGVCCYSFKVGTHL
jgi:hypothetical protein